MLPPHANWITHVWLSQVTTPETTEPIVTGALVTGGGIVILWFANRVLKLMTMMQTVMTALFGDAPPAVPNGVIRKLNTVSEALGQHVRMFDVRVREEEEWKAEARRLTMQQNTALQLRLTQIEDRLPTRRKS